ncbi:hypothetical protein FCE95_07575 [Luteimonas gilva]|uniref:Secreted protein n=1 Tax=Luteimonas gilva TaxID=2572684 RepID=A0A4U5JWS7_9GAMM|nr:hypothetical protein [Luteimonas gilva]TKR34115.1 hypothetical protein FCE95_07575 [Luteimonas gilva]
MKQPLRLSVFRLFVCALFLSLATHAIAQEAPIERQMTADEFKAAGLDKLSAAELAHLNAWLGRKAAQTPVTAAAPASPPPTGAGFIGDDQPVRSRLKGSIQEWGPGTVFELENGQRWRVLKGSMKLNKPLQSPEIEVAPGMMGRWFFQVDEDAPRPRVERIQ